MASQSWKIEVVCRVDKGPLLTPLAHILTMSTDKVPATQIAVITNKTSSKLVTISVPHPGPGEVLIKNVAVASNPKDWIVPDLHPDYEYKVRRADMQSL